MTAAYDILQGGGKIPTDAQEKEVSGLNPESLIALFAPFPIKQGDCT